LFEVIYLERVRLKSVSDHSWGALLGYIEDPDVSFPAEVDVEADLLRGDDL
jgi:hypothetical protein